MHRPEQNVAPHSCAGDLDAAQIHHKDHETSNVLRDLASFCKTPPHNQFRCEAQHQGHIHKLI